LAPIIGRHSIQRSCGHIYSTLIGKFLRQRTEKKGAVANCVGGHLLEFILCPFLSQGLSKHHTSAAHLVWANSAKNPVLHWLQSLFSNFGTLASGAYVNFNISAKSLQRAALIVRVCVRARERGAFF
jgi:hypothetical protein